MIIFIWLIWEFLCFWITSQSWMSTSPFDHSCNNRKKDRVLPTFWPRSIFGAFQLWFDYRLVEGGGWGVGYTYSYPKHLLLRVTKDHTFTRLCLVIPISPYLYPCLYPVSVQKPGINPLRTTPSLSPNIARSSLNHIHNGLETLCKKKCPK